MISLWCLHTKLMNSEKVFIFISILVVRVNNIKKKIGSHQISGFGLIVGWFACFFFGWFWFMSGQTTKTNKNLLIKLIPKKNKQKLKQ